MLSAIFIINFKIFEWPNILQQSRHLAFMIQTSFESILLLWSSSWTEDTAVPVRIFYFGAPEDNVNHVHRSRLRRLRSTHRSEEPETVNRLDKLEKGQPPAHVCWMIDLDDPTCRDKSSLQDTIFQPLWLFIFK